MDIEIELLEAGEELAPDPASDAIRQAVELTLAVVEVTDGHLAVDLVGADVMQAINFERRGRDEPTDVLAFPIDGIAGASAGPRELGDVVVCPELVEDLVEAVVHGVLHLCGYDHEQDAGEMLDLQIRLVEELRR